jgi:hypothetical protein
VVLGLRTQRARLLLEEFVLQLRMKMVGIPPSTKTLEVESDQCPRWRAKIRRRSQPRRLEKRKAPQQPTILLSHSILLHLRHLKPGLPRTTTPISRASVASTSLLSACRT